MLVQIKLPTADTESHHNPRVQQNSSISSEVSQEKHTSVTTCSCTAVTLEGDWAVTPENVCIGTLVLAKELLHPYFEAAVGNFEVNINNFLCSIWIKCHNTHRQLLVSDVVWEYGEISVFSHHASVFRTGKNPIAFVLFVTLSVLSVLNSQSTLRFSATGDVSASRLAVRALRSDSPLPQFKLDLKVRVARNENKTRAGVKTGKRLLQRCFQTSLMFQLTLVWQLVSKSYQLQL